MYILFRENIVNIFNSKTVTKYINPYTTKNLNTRLLSLFLKTIPAVVLKLNKIPRICASKVAIA